MANLRQTILIRTDLGFPTGLLAAQVAHLHLNRFRLVLNDHAALTPEDKEWLKDPYTFVHGVKNMETLNYFNKLAIEAGIPVIGWTDTVYIDISDTQRKAFPDVFVGIALGPCDSDKIKAVIGDLPLL